MPTQAPEITFDNDNQEENEFSEEDSFDEYNEY